MAIPIPRPEAMHGLRNGLKQRLCFDLDRVVDALDIAVCDPAERHAESLAFRPVFALASAQNQSCTCMQESHVDVGPTTLKPFTRRPA
jgi:hypothetical protein